MARDELLGQRFNWKHAAGVTRFQVDRAHRDAGYYECVSVRAVSGTHHFIGGIEVFSRRDIEAALKAETPDVPVWPPVWTFEQAIAFTRRYCARPEIASMSDVELRALFEAETRS